MSITAPDILAALDVLKQAGEESDDMEFELAANLRRACQELRAEAKVTIDLLEMEMLRQVETAPKQVGEINYLAVNNNKTTFDHDVIESDVVTEARRRAVNEETGEVDPGEAARQAAYMMRQVYVSASSTAKIGALGDVGVDIPAVRFRETRGRKLLEVDTQEG